MCRNKCAACYRQFNKMEHLVEHMRISYHSNHEPICGICHKHCRSFESLREHLIGILPFEKLLLHYNSFKRWDCNTWWFPMPGPLPKVECERIFKERGCDLCLNIFNSRYALQHHREKCQFSRGNVRQSNLNENILPTILCVASI